MAWAFYRTYLLLCVVVLLPPGPYPGEPLFPAIGGLTSGACQTQSLPCVKGGGAAVGGDGGIDGVSALDLPCPPTQTTLQSALRAASSPYTGEPLAGSDPEHCRIS